MPRYQDVDYERGGKFDLKKFGGPFTEDGIDWSWFPRTRDEVVNKVAPYTKKAVGPIVTALTGVSVPNPADVIANDAGAQAQAKELFTKMLDKPLAFGKPDQKDSKKGGKGFSTLSKH